AADHAGRRPRPQPGPARQRHAHPPTGRAGRLRVVRSAVQLRGGRAARQPRRCRLDRAHAALRAARVELPDHRPRAWHVVGVPRARMGGYWGWDPVENVALMPWLATTAYLHSAQVQERRGRLRAWNFGLVILAFL